MLRRTGVVSFGVVEPSEPISATSFMRRTLTAWERIVAAKRPGTCVFSLGGGPITRCRPRAGSSFGIVPASAALSVAASGSARVGTHQRGGRATAPNDFTRIDPGSANRRRTAGGRATPAANRRAAAPT